MESKELIDLIARRIERSSADTEKLLEGFVATLKERCSDLDSIAVPGFGTFEAKKEE